MDIKEGVDYNTFPDGTHRDVVGAICLNGYVYHIGELGVCDITNKKPTRDKVVWINSIGGDPGNLRICFENKTQVHVSNAIEIWDEKENPGDINE